MHHNLLLLFSCPPVREVCPNYEVVMFQPQTGTPPDLCSVDNCYIAILLNTPIPSLPAARFPPRGDTHARPVPLSLSHFHVSTQDYSDTCVSPIFVAVYRGRSPPASDSYSATSLPPLPLAPPKYLLMLHSGAFGPLFVATTVPGASPLPS